MHFEKNLQLGKLWLSFQKKHLRSRALQHVEMYEKYHLKWQEDKVEIMKSKKKPKKKKPKKTEAPAPREPQVQSPPHVIPHK